MSELLVKAEGISKSYRIDRAGAHREPPRWETLVSTLYAAPRRLLASLRSAPATEEQTFWALRDVSFQIAPGESLAILGRNGAGKSTLLKILSRVVAPTFGCIHLRARVGSLLEVGTGFHPDLTGRENVFLSGSILGMRREEIRRKFDAIVEFSGVSDFLDVPVKRYSSGMFLRLGFSVAAFLETEILVMDEILAVGDAAFQLRCAEVIATRKREGKSMLLVSHNMGLVQTLCTRGLLLDRGRVVAEGALDTVVPQYLASAAHSSFERMRPLSPDIPCIVQAAILGDEGQGAEHVDVEVTIHAPRPDRAALSICVSDLAGIPVGQAILGYYELDRPLALSDGHTRLRIRVDTRRLAVGGYFFELWLQRPAEQTFDRTGRVLAFSLERPRGAGIREPMQQAWGGGSYEVPAVVTEFARISPAERGSA